MNPARDKSISYRPSRVTAAVVTYIPNLEGYFAHRLEVLKLCLTSLIATMEPAGDIMVLNNGSCRQVREYLESLLESGNISYLVHAEKNLGVIGGFRILFNAAPGEVIAYCDDDVFYYPGWLKAHLEILDAFPGAGMVSGAPVGYSSEDAFTSVDQFISRNECGLQVVEKERNQRWEEDWAASTGRSIEEHISAIQNTPNIHLSYQDVEAVRSAKHFQFVTPKKVILEALEGDWSGSLMAGLVELDQKIDRLGYLRLSTPQRYARHIGNAVSQQLAREAETLKISSQIRAQQIEEHQHWLLNIPGSGRILWPLYRWLFKVLHGVR